MGRGLWYAAGFVALPVAYAIASHLCAFRLGVLSWRATRHPRANLAAATGALLATSLLARSRPLESATPYCRFRSIPPAAPPGRHG